MYLSIRGRVRHCAAPKPRNPSDAALAARTLNLGFSTNLDAGSYRDLGQGNLSRNSGHGRGRGCTVNARHGGRSRNRGDSYPGTTHVGVGFNVNLSLCVGFGVFGCLDIRGGLSGSGGRCRNSRYGRHGRGRRYGRYIFLGNRRNGGQGGNGGHGSLSGCHHRSYFSSTVGSAFNGGSGNCDARTADGDDGGKGGALGGQAEGAETIVQVHGTPWSVLIMRFGGAPPSLGDEAAHPHMQVIDAAMPRVTHVPKNFQASSNSG